MRLSSPHSCKISRYDLTKLWATWSDISAAWAVGWTRDLLRAFQPEWASDLKHLGWVSPLHFYWKALAFLVAWQKCTSDYSDAKFNLLAQWKEGYVEHVTKQCPVNMDLMRCKGWEEFRVKVQYDLMLESTGLKLDWREAWTQACGIRLTGRRWDLHKKF